MRNLDKNRRIARNTLFLYIRMGIVMLISLYTTRVVLRVLGIEDYGIYNVVCGFVAMFGIFNTSFSTCINRFYNYEIGKKTESGVKIVYNSAVIIQLVLAVAIVLIIEIVGSWYIKNVMILPPERMSVAKWIFQYAMISMFLTIMQAPYSAAVMAYEKMDYYAVVCIIDAFLKLGFVVILQYLDGDKLLIYGVLMCVVSITNFLLYFIYCRVKFPDIRLQKQGNKQMIKSMLSFAGWSALDPMAYMARDQGTNMVLNAFFGPVVNAAQGLAYQISTAIDSFGANFTTAFRPQIIQSYSEGQYGRTKNLMFSMSKINYLLHVMLAIPIILEINYILYIWLGEGYPKYAASFTSLILTIKCIGSLNTPISNVVSATGNIRRIKVFSAIVIVSVIPLSIVFFRIGFSPEYAYIALLFLTIVNQIGCVNIVSKMFPYIKLNEYIKDLMFPLLIFTICTLLIPLVIRFLLPTSIWRLLLVCFFSVVVSVLSGYFVVFNEAEKVMVRLYLLTFLKKCGIKK